MIIKSLYEYYVNNSSAKDENGDRIFPDFGYSSEKVGFKLTLSEKGLFESFDILSRTEFLPDNVAIDLTRTSNPTASHYFGNEKYLFGSSFKKNARQDALDRLEAFINLHQEIQKETDHKDIKSLLKFLSTVQNGSFDLSQIERVYQAAKDKGIVIISIEDRLLHEQKDLIRYWENKVKNYKGFWGNCMITGKTQNLKNCHGKIKGLGGAAGGCSLVSFNKPSHKSYLKADDSPLSAIGSIVAFGYCTVLNYFLSKNAGMNHSNLGKDYLVFWTNKHKDGWLCQVFKKLFSYEEEQGEPLVQVKSAVESFSKGLVPDILPDDSKFCLAMLTANNGRAYVREFIEHPLKEIATNVAQHCSDLKFNDYKIPSLYGLSWVSQSGKTQSEKKPHSDICRALLRSVLRGEQYPVPLALTVLGHALKPFEKEIAYKRTLQCMFLKAYLNRKYRNENGKEITVSLDKERSNVGYLLGRLLSISDKILTRSMGHTPNKTYEDRYRGSLSKTPKFVLNDLSDKVRAHLSKIRKSSKGLYIFLDREYSSVIDRLSADNIPTILSLEDQMEFVLGFQHEHSNQFQSQPTSTEEN